jgi:hypothetical protein
MSELEGLLEQVVELKKEIEDSAIPKDMKEFLLHLLSIMEAGICDYPVSGGSAFTHAFHEVVKAASTDGLQGVATDSDGYTKVMHLLRRCWGVSNEVVHMDRLIAFFGSKIEQGIPLLQWSMKPHKLDDSS